MNMFRDNMGYELLHQCKAPFDDDDEAMAPTGFTILEGDTKPLLVENARLIEQLLQEWRDGFLAVDTSRFTRKEDGEPEDAMVDHDEAKQRRIHAPMARLVYKHDDIIGLEGSGQKANLGSTDGEMDTVALLRHVVQFMMLEEAQNDWRVERIRTTLADLFSRRDSMFVPGEKDGRADGGVGEETATVPAGPRGGESMPNTKLRKSKRGMDGPAQAMVHLSSKMLKRKIHPEMEHKNNSKDPTKTKNERIYDGVFCDRAIDGAVNEKASTAGVSSQRSKRTSG